jgi:hypothetical protein
MAQMGATELKGPGIAVSVDYLPASRYIRPEDSVKTSSTTSQRRFNMGAAFSLMNRIDTATGKVRMLTLGLQGSYTSLDNKDYEKTIFPKELLETTVGLQYIRSMRNRWSLMVLTGATLGTDMEEITMDDLFLQGGVFFIKQHNRRFSYGIGGVLTNTFGAPMVLPAFFVKWQTESKLRVDINFPQKASVGMQLSKYTDLALAVRMNGASYDVTHGVGGKRLMGNMEMTAGLENTWRLNRHFDFVAAGGTTLLNAVTFSDKKLSEMFKDKPDHRLGTNYFLSAGLRWNFVPAHK